MTDLGAFGGEGGIAINESGHIAGHTTTPAGVHGFLWNGQAMIDLGPPRMVGRHR